LLYPFLGKLSDRVVSRICLSAHLIWNQTKIKVKRSCQKIRKMVVNSVEDFKMRIQGLLENSLNRNRNH